MAGCSRQLDQQNGRYVRQTSFWYELVSKIPLIFCHQKHLYGSRCTKTDFGWGLHQDLSGAAYSRYSEDNMALECGPMPNLMVTLPNIGGALCSMPQNLADAHH